MTPKALNTKRVVAEKRKLSEDSTCSSKKPRSDHSDSEFDAETLEKIDAIVEHHKTHVYQPEVLTQTQEMNQPLVAMNAESNLYQPALHGPAGNPLIDVEHKMFKGKRYVNVKYHGLSQKHLIGQGRQCYKMSVMTPFGKTRYCDALPYGSARNRFNDPESEFYRPPLSRRKPRLLDSTLSFQLTNERIDESEITNTEMDRFFDWMENCESMIFNQVAAKLDQLFPSIANQIKSAIEKEGDVVTKDKIRAKLSVAWKGIVRNDPKASHIRLMQLQPRLFRFATPEEQKLLASSDFESESKDDEITKLLKGSLTKPEGDDEKPMPKWDNDLSVFRCKTNAEQDQNPNGGPFEKMTYDEIRTKFAGQNAVVSVTLELSLASNDTKITLKHEPIGVLYLASASKFAVAPTLTNPSAIRFNFA